MTDWATYLAGFHARSPGITEDVLVRCFAGDATPYRWLCRAISVEGGRVLDVACGSGPVAATLTAEPAHKRPSWVVGVDTSAAELQRAASSGGRGRLLRADAGALPLTDGCFDAVTCSMALMVVPDFAAVVGEATRVLRVGGVFAATVPSAVPLRAQDVRVLGPLTARLRSAPQFPGGPELPGLPRTLSSFGFRVLEDARERFGYAVRTRADADLLVRSLYLPNTTDKRRASAAAWLAAQAATNGHPVEVAIPIRRVVALKVV